MVAWTQMRAAASEGNHLECHAPGVAAVDNDVLARDPASAIAEQKSHYVGHLVGRA